MSYVVSAPLVITKKQDGSDLYLYEKAEVPDFVADAEVKRLSDLGLVAKVDGRTSSGKAPKPVAESN